VALQAAAGSRQPQAGTARAVAETVNFTCKAPPLQVRQQAERQQPRRGPVARTRKTVRGRQAQVPPLVFRHLLRAQVRGAVPPQPAYSPRQASVNARGAVAGRQ